MSQHVTAEEIAGIMGWRGPGAYSAAAMRKVRRVIEVATSKAPSQKWISVADEMPCSGHAVMAAHLNEIGRVRIVRAAWVAGKTEESDLDSCIGSYDEATDTHWDPEGWYELIEHWPEYSGLFIGKGVTHWMPMPAGPDIAAGEAP